MTHAQMVSMVTIASLNADVMKMQSVIKMMAGVQLAVGMVPGDLDVL